jgi:hypothetical protein
VGERPIMVHLDTTKHTQERKLSLELIERKIEESIVVEVSGSL